MAGLSSPLSRRAVIGETRTQVYEGAATPVETLVQYSFDDEARTIEESYSGRLDLQGDEKRVQRTYASDDTTWVRDQVVEEKLLTAAGDVVADKRTFYGDDKQVLPLGAIGKGWVRQVQQLLLDPAGSRWITTKSDAYDARGNVVEESVHGVTRQLVYDDGGRFVQLERLTSNGHPIEWRATWDPVQELPTSLVGPNGETTLNTYDALGRLVSRGHRPGLPFVLYRYDWSAPRPQTITHLFEGDEKALGAFTEWAPNSGWREAIEVTNGAGEHLFTATRLTTDQWVIDRYTVRDERGAVTFRGEPFSSSGLPASTPAGLAGVHRSYDATGRTVREVAPTGAVSVSQFSAFTVTTTRDGLAPVTTRLDGLGRITHTERRVGDVVEAVDADYDARSEITRLGLQNGLVEHRYGYDSLGRLTSTTDPDSGARTLRYNDFDQLIEQVNGAGQRVCYEYDDVGRVTAVRTADGRGFVYHYDVAKDGSADARALGRVAWIEEPTGEMQLAYDGEGRLATTRRIVHGRSLQESHQYGASGKLLGVAFDDGFAYDLGYDDAGRLVRVGDFWSAEQLDPRGAVQRGRFGNGIIETFDRDASGQPIHLRIERASGGALYDVSATRNGFGAITTMQDGDGVGLDHSASFAYDAAGRLTQATIGGSGRQFQFGYAYDGLQNLVLRAASGPKSVGTFPGTYVYGEGGHSPRQLTRVRTGNGDVVIDYDAAGRMVRQGDWSLVYNEFDELVQVLDAAAKPKAMHEYGYDGLRTWTRNADGSEQIWLSPDVTEKNGRREHTVDANGRTVAKVSMQIDDLPAPATGSLVPASATSHVARRVARTAVPPAALVVLLLGFKLGRGRSRRKRRHDRAPGFALLGLAGLLVACGAHGPVAQQRAALSTAERVYFHQGFAAGPTLFTRQDGSIEEERTYEPFGAPIDGYREAGGSGSIGDVDFGVESRNELNSETDPNTEWAYQGARWMAPQLARWLSPDPPTKAPDPKFLLAPWDLNPYAYARANPVVFWDPDGQSWRTFGWGFAKGAVTSLAFVAAAVVAPEMAAAIGGAMLIKTGYDLYKNRHEVVALGHRIASNTTTDADHELFGQLAGSLVGGFLGARIAARFLKLPPTGGGCFAEGTPILTSRGLVPIESVQVGDLVWSRDTETGEEGWRPVTRTVIHEDEPLVALTIRDDQGREDTVLATPNHPFWVEGRGWTPAAELAPLDRVAEAGQKQGVVVSAVQQAATARVYNFEVEGWHTYFVGNDATLVHNNNPCFVDDAVSGPGRRGALNEAKRDLGIPRSQHPDSVTRTRMTRRDGSLVLGPDGKPIMTREYTYTRPDGSKVVIQDHSAGHQFGEDGVGDQGPHFNVRPPENTRTGSVPGTREHYEYKR